MLVNEMMFPVILLLLQVLGATAVSQFEPESVVRGGGGRVDPKIGDRMPSLFGPEEAQYDRYAACLAATEGLRRMRDNALSKHGSKSAAVPKLPWGRAKADGGANDGSTQASDLYKLQSGQVLEALGMSVNQFNLLGRQISRDKMLKEKVRYQLL